MVEEELCLNFKNTMNTIKNIVFKVIQKIFLNLWNYIFDETTHNSRNEQLPYNLPTKKNALLSLTNKLKNT